MAISGTIRPMLFGEAAQEVIGREFVDLLAGELHGTPMGLVRAVREQSRDTEFDGQGLA